MMTSYLGIQTLRKSISEYNMANLLHLIGLTFRAQRLQVENFFHTSHREYVMAAFDSFLESDAFQKVDQVRERQVRIRCAAQHSLESFLQFCHVVESNP